MGVPTKYEQFRAERARRLGQTESEGAVQLPESDLNSEAAAPEQEPSSGAEYADTKTTYTYVALSAESGSPDASLSLSDPSRMSRLLVYGGFALLESALLFVMRWFSLRQFPAWADWFWKTLSFDNLIWEKMMTYEQLITLTAYVFSFLAGGLLIFLVIKPVEKIVSVWKPLPNRWLAVFPLLLFVLIFTIGTALHWPAAGIAGWTESGTADWLCPFLSYLGGFLIWLMAGTSIAMKP